MAPDAPAPAPAPVTAPVTESVPACARGEEDRGMTTDEKIELIVVLYPDSPPHRTVDGENEVGTMVWDFLREVKDNHHAIDATQMSRLLHTKWFAGFLAGRQPKQSRSTKRPKSNLSVQGIIDGLLAICPHAEPTEPQQMVVNTMCGLRVALDTLDALKYLKAVWNTNDGPSSEDKVVFKKLPWSEEWLSKNVYLKPPDTHTVVLSKQATGKAVGKEVRVLLLRLFYPLHAPTWKDRHLVRVDKERLWDFKPVQYMDDIANTWLGGERRAAALSLTEKRSIETLPWFDTWLDRLRNKRKHREMAKATIETSDYAEKSKRRVGV